MRLIDADALEYHKQLECMGNGQYEDVKVVYEWEIDNASTIDAVEVVRCKDCDRGFGSPVCPIQGKGWAINKDTFFCAWGERSEP